MTSLFQTTSGGWHWPSIISALLWLVSTAGLAATLYVNSADRLAARQKELENTQILENAKIETRTAREEAAKARALAEEIERKQAPRAISPDQQARIVAQLKSTKRFPIRVAIFSTKQEAIKFGNQIRQILDSMGFMDSAHPIADSIIGPSLNTQNNEAVALAYPKRENIDPDMPIQKAFIAAGIPMATVLDGALGLAPGEIAVVVADK